MTPLNTKKLDYLHYDDQFDYFLPDLSKKYIPSNSLSNNEVYVTQGNCPKNFGKTKRKEEIICNEPNSFYCPLNYRGKIEIKYF